MSVPTLVDAFADGLGASAQTLPANFETILAKVMDRALPAMAPSIDAHDFARHLGSLCRAHAPLFSRLEALHAADLWVAYACTRGDRGALAQLERQYLVDARRALGAMGLSASDRDDVLQKLRTLLLGTAQHNPKLLTFRGEGPLARWIRITAVRLVSRPSRSIPADDALLAAVPDFSRDPELAQVRMDARIALKQAFEATVLSLSTADRLMLRQSALDGLSIDALGRAHGIHRATAARRLARIRKALLSGTKARLRAERRWSPDELESLIGRAQSQLDITLERVLAPVPGDDGHID